MDKKEACHKLAEINEHIYDLENSLEDIRSRLLWDDDNRDWLLERQEERLRELEKAKEEHNSFYEEYSDIIHS